MIRPWFALLTALLFGATLSTPMSVGDGAYEPAKTSLSAVADTTGRIENGQFNIPGKPIMLEPVVAHQNGTQLLLQCP